MHSIYEVESESGTKGYAHAVNDRPTGFMICPNDQSGWCVRLPNGEALMGFTGKEWAWQAIKQLYPIWISAQKNKGK